MHKNIMKTVIAVSVAATIGCSAASAGEAPQIPPFDKKVYITNRDTLYCFDEKGKIESELKLPVGRLFGSVHFLKNGNILCLDGHQLVICDPEGKEIFKFKGRKGSCSRWFKPLDNGNILFQESSPVVKKAGEDGKVIRVPEGFPRIIEVSLEGKGKIVNQVELELNELGKMDISYQIRDVKYRPNGNILVAHQELRAVNEYAPDGGFLKTLFKPEKGAPHSLYVCKNGNTLVTTIEGNAAGVFEVDQTGEIVWHILRADIPEAQLQYLPMVKRLENGNTLIVNHKGHRKEWSGFPLIEVSPDKKIVHALTDNQTIRVSRWATLKEEK